MRKPRKRKGYKFYNEQTGMAWCRVCSEEFEPTQRKIMKHDWICIPCKRQQEKEYRDRRKANGNSISKVRLQVPSERQKQNARWLVWKAIQQNKLSRQPCELCGEKTTEAHHTDYSKPLDVVWLCKRHHRELHYPRGEQ